eukprot:1138496-Amphidinium_carterae.1
MSPHPAETSIAGCQNNDLKQVTFAVFAVHVSRWIFQCCLVSTELSECARRGFQVACDAFF